MHLQNIIQATYQFLRCDRYDPHMDYQNARELLWDLPCTLQNIQEMIDSVSLFSHMDRTDSLNMAFFSQK